MLYAESAKNVLQSQKRRRGLTDVLGGEKESFPVKLLVLCFFLRALRLLLLRRSIHHARHLNVAFTFAEPHGG